MILETNRLFLRQISHSDLSFVTALHRDSEVMRYIGAPRTPKESQNRIKRICKYYHAHPGYGIWMACKKDNKSPQGWACLKDLDGTRSKEIGYRLARKAWGLGYATELSTALVKYGFEKKRLKKIVGVTHPDNHGSQRVLEKAGLQYVKKAFYYQNSVWYYHLYRADWES